MALWLGKRGFLWWCELVLPVVGRGRGQHSTAGSKKMQWQCSDTPGTPLSSPAPRLPRIATQYTDPLRHLRRRSHRRRSLSSHGWLRVRLHVFFSSVVVARRRRRSQVPTGDLPHAVSDRLSATCDVRRRRSAIVTSLVTCSVSRRLGGRHASVPQRAVLTSAHGRSKAIVRTAPSSSSPSTGEDSRSHKQHLPALATHRASLLATTDQRRANSARISAGTPHTSGTRTSLRE